MKISELRARLRAIRKRLADNIGYGDFKYLHKMKRPELEALLKKYEKFETNVGTIQQAIRNKRARNTASNLLNERDRLQVIRDIEQRLIEVQRPQSAPAIVGRNVGLSASSKRSAISNMYQQSTPLFTKVIDPKQYRELPPVKYRNRLPPSTSTSLRPLSASVSSLSLPRVQTKPRPASAGRTYNKFQPL